MLDDAIFIPNTTQVIIAHEKDQLQKIFRKVKIAFDNFPDNLKPKVKYDNKNELYFSEQNSTIYVALEVRGGTANTVHFSEAAFTNNFENKFTATVQSVPKGGTVRIETTANGLGGPFYRKWSDAKSGDSNYKPHFYNWTWEPEYVMPAVELLPDELAYMQQHNLTPEQMAWRRWKIKETGARLFPQEFPLTPGEAFIASGGNRFDVMKLQAMAAKAAPTVHEEEFVKIWKMPEGGKHYVMGTDCSKGLQTGDWQATSIIEFNSGEQVAEIRGRMPIERFADLSAQWGRKYNNALWGIELQDHGYAAINHVKNTYPNLYRRTVLSSVSDKRNKEIGWSTNSKTKPVMIAELDKAIRDGGITLHSPIAIQECITYLEDADGKTNAAEGEHDDTVIANAIAWQMRDHVRTGPVSSQVKPAGL